MRALGDQMDDEGFVLRDDELEGLSMLDNSFLQNGAQKTVSLQRIELRNTARQADSKWKHVAQVLDRYFANYEQS